MKIVAALTDPADAALAAEQGADLVELRFDLIETDPLAAVQQCRKLAKMPVIATFRSAQEGGQYFGNPEEWEQKIRPVLPFVEYVDVEQGFARQAGFVKEANKKIIASHHAPIMMPLPILFTLERELRMYGDIVKIIVTPKSENDVIELAAFTQEIRQPICTGVMGTGFRYARAFLPLFGSELAYCHVGKETAGGQYSVDEFRELMRLLKG